MFHSFFPNPRVFFLSALLWGIIMVAVWYALAGQVMSALGIPVSDPDNPTIGIQYFWEPDFLVWYAYFIVGVGMFYLFWRLYDPNQWINWSILGSALILFTTYFQVQVSVSINAWYGPFYDLVQAAVSKARPVTANEFWIQFGIFSGIAFVAVFVGILTSFFVSHYIFRWRTAMNDFYMTRWQQLRVVEGAAQRVQEDTMNFSQIMEGLGVNFVNSIMTLIAFLPVLVHLSENVKELPLVGAIPNPLVVAAVTWSIFGTGLLALIGVRLPNLQFRNQRVEAAYRKELVYGEDSPNRAQPPSVSQLFDDVRRNYFRIYFNYTYFNLGRILYLQADNIFVYLILVPTLVAGLITLGTMNQILNAFGQVSGSFQYLINSWTTIIDLMSIFKRLRAFESVLYGGPVSPIEKEVESAAQAAVRAAQTPGM